MKRTRVKLLQDDDISDNESLETKINASKQLNELDDRITQFKKRRALASVTTCDYSEDYDDALFLSYVLSHSNQECLKLKLSDIPIPACLKIIEFLGQKYSQKLWSDPLELKIKYSTNLIPTALEDTSLITCIVSSIDFSKYRGSISNFLAELDKRFVRNASFHNVKTIILGLHNKDVNFACLLKRFPNIINLDCAAVLSSLNTDFLISWLESTKYHHSSFSVSVDLLRQLNFINPVTFNVSALGLTLTDLDSKLIESLCWKSFKFSSVTSLILACRFKDFGLNDWLNFTNCKNCVLQLSYHEKSHFTVYKKFNSRGLESLFIIDQTNCTVLSSDIQDSLSLILFNNNSARFTCLKVLSLQNLVLSLSFLSKIIKLHSSITRIYCAGVHIDTNLPFDELVLKSQVDNEAIKTNGKVTSFQAEAQRSSKGLKPTISNNNNNNRTIYIHSYPGTDADKIHSIWSNKIVLQPYKKIQSLKFMAVALMLRDFSS